MGEAETTGTILLRSMKVMRDNAMAAAVAVASLAVIDTILDSRPQHSFALSGILSSIAQYALVVAALRKSGLMPNLDRAARFPATFGLLWLSGLATLAGLLLLIVPGIILAVRWSIAVPILLAEQTGIREAMRLSWQRTEGRFWPIFGAFAVLAAVLVVFGGGAIFFFDGNIAGGFAANVVINGATAAMWYAGVAIYQGGATTADELEKVFT